jgi:hypothetical protein
VSKREELEEPTVTNSVPESVWSSGGRVDKCLVP